MLKRQQFSSSPVLRRPRWVEPAHAEEVQLPYCDPLTSASGRELASDSFGSRPSGSSSLRHARERPLGVHLDLHVEPREEPLSEVHRPFDQRPPSASCSVHHRHHAWHQVKDSKRSERAQVDVRRVLPGRCVTSTPSAEFSTC